MKSGLNQYFEEVLLSPNTKVPSPKVRNKVARTGSNKITLSQYFERELLEETTAAERMQEMDQQPDSIDEIYDEEEEEEAINEDEEIDIYTSYASYMSSSDPGSDNLLVTFDYGFEDSLDADLSLDSQQLDILDKDEQLNKNLFKIPEEESSEDLLKVKHADMYSKSPIIFKLNDVPCSEDLLEVKHTNIRSKSPNIFKIHQEQSSENLLTVNHNERYSKSPNIFKVHQVKHLKGGSSDNIDTRASSCVSVATSLVEYNIDTSGDYGSWAQSVSEHDEGECNEKTYRYEDLIKNEEVLIYDDDVGNDILNGDNEREVLINFDFDEDQPPRWFNNNNNNINHNEQLYYRSVDYLN